MFLLVCFNRTDITRTLYLVFLEITVLTVSLEFESLSHFLTHLSEKSILFLFNLTYGVPP